MLPKNTPVAPMKLVPVRVTVDAFIAGERR